MRGKSSRSWNFRCLSCFSIGKVIASYLGVSRDLDSCSGNCNAGLQAGNGTIPPVLEKGLSF